MVSLLKTARPAKVKESTQTAVLVRLVGAKEESWSYNLPFVVLGVMVAAAEKCSVSGLEPSIVWSVAEPDGAGPRFILAQQNPSKPSLKPSRVEYLFEKSSADWSRVVA